MLGLWRKAKGDPIQKQIARPDEVHVGPCVMDEEHHILVDFNGHEDGEYFRIILTPNAAEALAKRLRKAARLDATPLRRGVDD